MSEQAIFGTVSKTGSNNPPSEWRWLRLGEHVAKIGSGVTPRGGSTSYLSEGIPLIRSQNVHMNRFEPNGLAFISDEQDAAMSNSRVQERDILLNITGASIGRVCIVPSELCPANVNQHVSIIRCDSGLHSEYLAFYLAQRDFQKSILDSQAGATRQALTKELIEGFLIAAPPLSEQKRVAGILKEQLAAVERARGAAEAQLEAAKALPAAYLREVFDAPDNANGHRKPIGEVCQLLPSKSIATAGDAEVRAITTACLTESGFDPSGIKTARMWSSDAEACVVAPNEVLIARSNTTELVGRVAMFPGEPTGTVASDLTIRIWTGENVEPQFLTTYLSFLYVMGYWREKAGGASGSMKKITRSQVNSLPIPVPEIDEQRAIVRSVSTKMSRVRELEVDLRSELKTIEALPASLLRCAFQGQI